MKRRSPETIINESKEATTELHVTKAVRETSSWKAKHKEAVDTAIELEQRLEALLAIQERPLVGTVLGKLKPSNGRKVAVIVPATDWHVEERVYASGTNGKNDFDLPEAERRIGRFYQKVLELIDWQNNLAPVGEIWHPLLGDLLTGYIHEELMETNSLSPTEACVFLREMICSGIDLWLRATKLPIFLPTCVGNHGRTTVKKRIKTSYKNSYEWLLYMTLAKQYEKNRRVFWLVGQGYHSTQIIMERRVRFHHGDGLRYQGGVGGITIPVNKSISQWDKVDAVDLDVFGHWHTFLQNYPKWISCGSLMGYSEYSVEIKAEFQAPTQTFIVLDRNYGMTCAVPIFLTKSHRKAREDGGRFV
jgi:hypothetical protein